MRKIVQLLLFALIGMMFTMCDSDNIHIGNVRLSLCDLSFFGDSTAVFIAKNLQN